MPASDAGAGPRAGAVKVTISVSRDVVAELEAAGLREIEVLDALGIVTGTIDDPEPLRRLDGVEAVEASRTVGI